VKANELAFFGKIAASVTHELRNVLAVINETNGLMADLLAMMREAPFPYREKFQRSVQKIEEQVRRGVEITSRFNRFAHSMDQACADIDLNSIVTQTVSLAQRLAALRNVELKGSVCDHPVMLFTNAFRIQMALTMAIDAFIGCMSASGSILMLVRDDLGSPSLNFYFGGESCEKVVKEAVAKFGEWQEFEELASSLGMRYNWRASDGDFVLFFSRLANP
jgi:phosphoglycerate-specific signal transduction histidine kinase